MFKQIKTTATAMLFLVSAANAQLTISSGAVFNIQTGALVTVQGDVLSNADITGAGKVVLKGSANQNVNMNGFTIPNLEMDNAANATLTGNAKIGSSILFTNGKILIGASNATIASDATTTGAASTRYFETNGIGEVRKTMDGIGSNANGFIFPVGSNNQYRPVSMAVTGATYGSSPYVGVRNVSLAAPTKPISIASYIETHWPVSKSAIITGNVVLTGSYVDPTDVVVGVEANLKGYYYNGTDWSSTTGNNNSVTNTVGNIITANNGILYGMNKYVLVNAKALLQGPYDASTGLMSEGLRTGTGGIKIPFNEPYRTATYNDGFIHFNNSILESTTTGVLGSQASVNDNIVDWVYLELRNNTTGVGSVIQTRSGLLKRNGNIVDVDGISPITFNNIPDAQYTIAVRHRNHLGLATDITANRQSLTEDKLVSPIIDFRTFTDANLFGTSTAFVTTTNSASAVILPNATVNLMWAGDADHNLKVKYSGSSSDLPTVLANVTFAQGNPSLPSYSYNSGFGYWKGDINLDGKVKYSGSSNDVQVILNTILTNPPNTASSYSYNSFLQQLP